MNEKKKLLTVVLVLVVVIALAYALYDYLGAGIAPTQLSPAATPAPELTEADPEPAEEETPERIALVDVPLFDADGNEVRLQSFVGKPLVINFWATWCPYCLQEMPHFQEQYEAVGDRVQFLMIDVADGSRETVSAGQAFIEKQGYTFPVVYDTSLNAAYAYGASALPITYFIDAEGYVVAGYRGALTAELLQMGIDMILPATE